jgi:hypothetical protein
MISTRIRSTAVINMMPPVSHFSSVFVFI